MATFNPLDPFGSLADFMCEGAIEGWKKTASWVLTSGALGDAQWTVANDTLNHVAGVMGFVAVGVGAYSIVKNALRGRAGEVFASLFATVLAWPLTVVCATLLVRGVGVGDKLTSKILEWNTPAFDEIELDASVFGDVFGIVFALILALLIVIGGVVMLVMTCVRLFLIILGVGFLPVVTMLIGLDSMRAGLARYANWIIGVILMQPLMAVIMYICAELMKGAGPDAPLTYLVAATGVILSSICPWMLVRVVGQFLPFQSGSTAAANAGASTVQAGANAATQAADMGVRVATGGLSAGAVDLGAKAAAADAARLGAGDGRPGASGQGEGASTGEKLKAAGRGFGGHAGAFAGAMGEYMDARDSARDAAAGDNGGHGGDAAPGTSGGPPVMPEPAPGGDGRGGGTPSVVTAPPANEPHGDGPASGHAADAPRPEGDGRVDVDVAAPPAAQTGDPHGAGVTPDIDVEVSVRPPEGHAN